MNVVPAAHINNLARDGLATVPFTNVADGTRAVVEQCVFTRGGERYPLQYNLDTSQKESAYVGNDTMDTQLARNYMNAVMGLLRLVELVLTQIITSILMLVRLSNTLKQSRMVVVLGVLVLLMILFQTRVSLLRMCLSVFNFNFV